MGEVIKLWSYPQILNVLVIFPRKPSKYRNISDYTDSPSNCFSRNGQFRFFLLSATSKLCIKITFLNFDALPFTQNRHFSNFKLFRKFLIWSPMSRDIYQSPLRLHQYRKYSFSRKWLGDYSGEWLGYVLMSTLFFNINRGRWFLGIYGCFPYIFLNWSDWWFLIKKELTMTFLSRPSQSNIQLYKIYNQYYDLFVQFLFIQ